jgi:3-O-methylgallate 3,4-dioxygenase
MARLAAAFGTSHSVMLAARLEDWLTRFRDSDKRMPYYDREGRPLKFDEVLARAPSGAGELITPQRITGRFNEVQGAMARMKTEIAAAKLDALVIVGDDQHEVFRDQNMPAIGVYYGDTIRNAGRASAPQFRAPEEWYRNAQMRRYEDDGEAHYPCHPRLALHLIEGLVQEEFDITALSGLDKQQCEGHAYSFIHRWYLGESRLPIVPIFLNTYYEPNPPLPRRCVRLGEALRGVIARYPEDIRVGVMASGGLSHFIVDEELDRGVIDAMKRKDTAFLASLDPRRLKAGSSEIRNWIVVGAAATEFELTWVSYTPAYRTPALTGTGLCFARWS